MSKTDMIVYLGALFTLFAIIALKTCDDIPEAKKVALIGKLEDKIDKLRNMSIYYV